MPVVGEPLIQEACKYRVEELTRVQEYSQQPTTAALPPHWRSVWDPNWKEFYYVSPDGESQWNHPASHLTPKKVRDLKECQEEADRLSIQNEPDQLDAQEILKEWTKLDIDSEAEEEWTLLESSKYNSAEAIVPPPLERSG